MTNNPRRPRAHAIVPRSLLAYARIGIGVGVVPFCVSGVVGCTGSPSVGIEPAMDLGSGDDASTSDVSVGILPDTSSFADADASAPHVSIGIDPAMQFEAGAADEAGEDSGDANDSNASDASADAVVDP
jgi:hypothetical protein